MEAFEILILPELVEHSIFNASSIEVRDRMHENGLRSYSCD